MSLDDSLALTKLVETDDVDRDEVREILGRYFQLNDDVIWRAALEEYATMNVHPVLARRNLLRRTMG